MRVMVSGSTGLIGRNLVRVLAEAGFDVLAVSRRPLQYRHPLVENLFIDFEKDSWSTWKTNRVDAVVHLAQSEKFREFPVAAKSIVATNLESTLGLLDWAYQNDVKHFVYASTGGVYAASSRYREASTPLKTPGELDFYFSTKLASEAFVQCYAGLFSVAVMRFFFVYGPNQNRKMLLPRIYDRVAKGEEIFLDGEDGFMLNPIHVADAVRAIQSSLVNSQPMVTNVAGPEVLSLREISEIFGEHARKKPCFVKTGKLASDMVGDTSFMVDNLFRPTKTLREMVCDLAPGNADD